MNDFKNTSIGLVPDEWDIDTLENIVVEDSNITYGVVQPGPEDENGVLFIRGGDIKHGKIAVGLRTISKSVSDKYSRTLLKGGELLVSLVGYPGECAIVPDEMKGTNIARQVAIIRLKTTVNKHYIQQYLSSEIGKKNLLGNLVGSAQQVINLNMLRQVRVPLPSLPEQKKIADILSTVDEKIEVIDQQIAETEELKKSLMQRLLTKGIGHSEFKNTALGEIPNTWTTIKMNEIADITSSKRIHKRDYVNDGIPFFRGKEITLLAKRTELKDIVYIKKETYYRLKTKYGAPEIGDILITAVGTIGSIYMVGKSDEFYFKDGNLMWLRNISPLIYPTYLLYFLRSELFQNEIKNTSSGSSQSALTIVKFKKLFINLPSLVEQKKIGKVLRTVDDKIESLNSKRNLYHKLKTGLMQKLLTGQIRVNSLIEV